MNRIFRNNRRPTCARSIGSKLAQWLGSMALLGISAPALASEATLKLPNLSSVPVIGNTSGQTLLAGGMVICVFGLLFGLWQYMQLKRLPVHRAMREISELIYATCKTYLITQGKFILVLEAFIG